MSQSEPATRCAEPPDVGPQSDVIFTCKVKVKFTHTRYGALGPELIPVYRQSARR